MPKGPGSFAVIGGTEALGRVLDEEQAVFLADSPDGVIVAGIAQDIYRHHGFGGQLPLRAHCLNLPF